MSCKTRSEVGAQKARQNWAGELPREDRGGVGMQGKKVVWQKGQYEFYHMSFKERSEVDVQKR